VGKKDEGEWKTFAVVDGNEEPLTEAEIHHIFENNP
jgi:hypothetical protein